MARIRTIKPEMWTDPEFATCSPLARLLFLGALNFASDYGVLPDMPARLKMQVLPADAVDAVPLVDELVACGKWERAVAPDGAAVLVIPGFRRHQRVDRPTAGRWGNPAEWESASDSTSPDESSLHLVKDRESSGTEKELELEGKRKHQPDTHTQEPAPQAVDKIVADAARLYGLSEAITSGARNPQGYSRSVVERLLAHDGEAARQWVVDHPSASAHAVAVNVFGLTKGQIDQVERHHGGAA